MAQKATSLQVVSFVSDNSVNLTLKYVEHADQKVWLLSNPFRPLVVSYSARHLRDPFRGFGVSRAAAMLSPLVMLK